MILTVEHDFALLPGPARILARRSDAAIGSDPQNYPGSDSVARRLKQNQQGIYTYPMSATVKIVNEGEKPVLPYTQRLGGQQASTGWPQVPSYQQSLPWRVHPHPLPTPNGMRK